VEGCVKVPKIVNFRVKVHTCKLGKEITPFEGIRPGNRYVIEDAKVDYVSNFYQRIAPRCRCRRYMQLFDANELVKRGEACRVLRCKHGKIVEDEYQIWMAMVRVTSKLAKAPRIDLITSRDIEGAYVECNRRFIKYIEDVHKMFMKERAKLIVEFKEDPFEGRVLFPFGPDQRTTRKDYEK
jgi:hypothetical protein